MRRADILILASLSAVTLGGTACHHAHHHDRYDEPVAVDRGPDEVFYDEGGGRISDPVLIRRIRYYDDAPDQIAVRDNVYYYRGRPVRDPEEIKAMRLAQLHARNREIKNERYDHDRDARDRREASDRAERDKRAELDRAEKQKREELDRAEKQKREELDRAEKQKRETYDRAEKQKQEELARKQKQAEEARRAKEAADAKRRAAEQQEQQSGNH